jgi:signal transduction histidine kinase
MTRTGRRVARVAWTIRMAAVLIAMLVAAVALGAHRPWPELGVLAAGLTLGLVAASLGGRRLRRAAEWAERRRLAAAVEAIGRLARLRDAAEIAARAEPLLRDLLPCDAASVTRDDAPSPSAGAVQLVRPLRNAAGELIGRVTASRRAGPPFAEADATLLDALARAVAGALEAAEARVQAERVIGTIGDGLLLLDPGARIRTANDAAGRILRRNQEALLGASLFEWFPDLAGGDFAMRLRDGGAEQRPIDVTAAAPGLGGWFELRCYPFEGGATLILRDVTAGHGSAERQRQSQRLEELGQLTGGIAHDVNNLLTVILGNFEMLALSAEERGAAGAEDAELAQAGLRAGANASQLMHRLLAFSRRQPLSPQAVDVGSLLRGLEPLLRRSVGDALTLSVEVPEGVWPVVADPAELENALINLAINARDATTGGGRLAIAAANVAMDRLYAAGAGFDRTGDYVMITVADNGGGMTPEVMEHAFDPFFTTKPPGKGTGLGLSMVYGFARQSEGHVMLDSEPGQGTIVRLYLPRSTAAALPCPLQEERAARGGGETVLLVDDSEAVRGQTAAMLRDLGYRVLPAADGPAALDRLRQGARPDLLLTEVVVAGGLSGRQVAEQAVKLVPGLRVLFTSGYSGRSPGGPERGSTTAVLGKPFRRAELAARVKAQLAAAPWQPAARPPLAADAKTR